MSSYEESRLARIARNQAMLEKLGLTTVLNGTAPLKTTPRAKPAQVPEQTEDEHDESHDESEDEDLVEDIEDETRSAAVIGTVPTRRGPGRPRGTRNNVLTPLPLLTSFKKNPFVAAIASNNWDELCGLLQSRGKTVNDDIEHGLPPLAIAAKLGRQKVVERLLADRRVNLNGCRPTPLMLATVYGHFEVVQRLLSRHDRGVDINIRNEAGRTAFYFAAATNNQCIIDLFLRLHCKGVFVDFSIPDLSDKERFSLSIDPFLVPSEETKKRIRDYLQENEVDIEPLGDWIRAGTTTLSRAELDLHRAALNGDLAQVKELLKDDDLDVNAADRDGLTALMAACYAGHVQVIKEIAAQSDTETDLQDRWGRTAYAYAAAKGYCEIIDWMGGQTHVAKRRGKKSFVFVFKIDSVDRFGKSAPFMDIEGLFWPSEEAVRLLHLKYYMRCSNEDWEHDRAKYGNLDVLEFALLRASNPISPSKRPLNKYTVKRNGRRDDEGDSDEREEREESPDVRRPHKRARRLSAVPRQAEVAANGNLTDDERNATAADEENAAEYEAGNDIEDPVLRASPAPPCPRGVRGQQSAQALPTPGPSQPTSPVQRSTTDNSLDQRLASLISETEELKRARESRELQMQARAERIRELQREQEEDQRRFEADERLIESKERKIRMIEELLSE